MLVSWAVIVSINVAWVTYLCTRRRVDHPWLAAFFGVFAVTDTTSWLFDCRANGGLEIITPSLIGRTAWVGIVASLWISWFIALLVFILRLYRGKIPLLCLVVTAAISALVANAEALGASTMTRRLLMHAVAEPVLIVATLYYSGRYIARQVATGGRIDFLASAVILTTFMLAIRLLLLLDKRLLLERWQSHVLFYFYMSVVVAMYFFIPRLRRWFLFH